MLFITLCSLKFLFSKLNFIVNSPSSVSWKLLNINKLFCFCQKWCKYTLNIFGLNNISHITIVEDYFNLNPQKERGVIFMKAIFVPVSDKYGLTIEEAAAYFGIGEEKIRKLLSNNPDADYLLTNGRKTIIKRKRFEEYLNNIDSI